MPPNEKWGPALLPAPTAPSEGSAGVCDLIRRSFTVLNPGSPAQASLPSMIDPKDILTVPRPFLDRTPFASASPGGSAFATEGSTLPAPLASWSGMSVQFPLPKKQISFKRSIACRRRSGLPSLVSRRRPGTSVPITLLLCAPPRVAQSGFCRPAPVDNGDIAHNRSNLIAID